LYVWERDICGHKIGIVIHKFTFIHLHTMDVLPVIDALLEKAFGEVEVAAETRDGARVDRLNDKIRRLERLRRTLLDVYAKVNQIQSEPTGTPGGQDGQKLRVMTIRVTEGMLKNNMLTVSPYLKQGIVRYGEEMQIEVTSPYEQRFRTVIIQQGNKLQARGPIRRFLLENKIKPDDEVMLREVSFGTWQLTKAEPPNLALLPV
jgi:hypothetical protein